MSDLIDFIRARLDEYEQIARAATTGPWAVDNPTYAEAILNADGVAVVAGGRWGGEASVFESTEDAQHIARHDPARVLREVEAKRRRLARHQPWTPDHGPLAGKLACGCSNMEDQWYAQEWPCDEIRDDASAYADHPDYREEWRP